MPRAALGRAHFVVVGAGGLGCPALLGLVASGAGSITIVDDDAVEPSNLHRQVLYELADVGAPKAVAAQRRLAGRGSELVAERRRLAADPVALARWLGGVRGAVVLECTDDPALKFALADAAAASGTPIAIGGVVGLGGLAAAWAPGLEAACYRCVFEAPPARLADCASAGVLGSVCGAVGFQLAALAIALAVQPEAAAGLIWSFAGLPTTARARRPRPRAGCPACGASAARPPRPSPAPHVTPSARCPGP